MLEIIDKTPNLLVIQLIVTSPLWIELMQKMLIVHLLRSQGGSMIVSSPLMNVKKKPRILMESDTLDRVSCSGSV